MPELIQSGGAENMTDKLNDLAGSGFIKHVTRFDSETKSELLNLIQYILLITLPVFFLNKTVQNMMPKYDERNGNIELLGEVLLSSVCLLLGIYIAHRVIIYLPTFSGNSLAELNFMNVALLIGFCMMYSENGKKINRVYERLMDSWNGKEGIENIEKDESKKDGSTVKVSQPLSGNMSMQAPMPTHQVHQSSRADLIGREGIMNGGGRSNVVQQAHNSPAQQIGQQQQVPGNSMGGGGMMNEPMAANEGFGAFSSF